MGSGRRRQNFPQAFPQALWKSGKVAIVGIALMGMMGCWNTAPDNLADARPKPTAPHPTMTQPHQKPQPSRSPAQSMNPPVNPQLVAANTRFGFKLFSQLVKQDSNQNVFVSPSSVAIALSMVYNGASDKTQQAMAEAMELQGMSLSNLNQGNAVLRDLLQNPDDNVQLAIANSIWAQQEFPFQPEFIQQAQKFYAAAVENVNFSDLSTNRKMNQWVKKNTRNKIQEIVPENSPLDLVMMLMNAIYFKGKWSTPFDPAATQNQPFQLLNGQQKSHPTMAQTGRFQYYETDQFQAISLPYGKKRVSLYVFLPKSNSSLTDFYQTLNADNWQTWMTQFRSRPGRIQIPRFKLEYQAQLRSALTALGMGIAFQDAASFSRLARQPVAISEVKHKTFVEVNEEGTEAAAVTSIGIRATSAQREEPPFQMVVDRPFFCAIRDNQTGTVLFMGSIVEPR